MNVSFIGGNNDSKAVQYLENIAKLKPHKLAKTHNYVLSRYVVEMEDCRTNLDLSDEMTQGHTMMKSLKISIC